jgi:hypothetical protein
MGEEGDYDDAELRRRLPSPKGLALFLLAGLATVAALAWMGFVLWAFIKALVLGK